VPMMKEIYPEIDFVAWFGVFAPAGTPPSIVNKMSEALAAISRDPEMKPYLTKFALAPNPGTPQQLAAVMQVDYVRYGKLVKELNLRMD